MKWIKWWKNTHTHNDNYDDDDDGNNTTTTNNNNNNEEKKKRFFILASCCGTIENHIKSFTYSRSCCLKTGYLICKSKQKKNSFSKKFYSVFGFLLSNKLFYTLAVFCVHLFSLNIKFFFSILLLKSKTENKRRIKTTQQIP